MSPRLKALLAKKVGGIPVVAIAGVIAAVILFFVFRMRSGKDTTTTDAPTDADAATGDGGPQDDTQQPTFSVADPTDPVASATPVVTTTATNDTNDAWQRRVVTWLMGNGYTLEVATTAISRYLAGDTLNTEQAKARDAAVTQFGLPPESIPDTPVRKATSAPTNTPATKQGVPPLNHEVKGTRDNTPAELAVLYYGTNNSDATDKIKAANDTKVSPYTVGTKVHIPENYEPKYFEATGHIHTLYDIARRNGVDPAKVEALNPGMDFPVKVGTRVRVK